MHSNSAAWFGIPFRYTLPILCADGRTKVNLYIYHPHSGAKIPGTSHKQVVVSNNIDLFDRINSKMAEFAEEYQQYFFGEYLAGRFDSMLFAYFVTVRWDYIAVNAWPTPAKSVKNKQYWIDHLETTLGAMPFNSLLTEPELCAAMDKIWRRNISKRGITDDERHCWFVLDHIFEDAEKLGLINSNPAKNRAAKYRESSRTIALANLNRYDLTLDELQRVCEDAVIKLLQGHLEGAIILLSIFLGLDIYEICGLDIDHISKVFTEIQVSQEYYQRRGSDPQLRPCQRYSQYRRIPCTQLIEEILRIVKRVRPSTTEDQKALFVDSAGNRLTPNAIKKLAIEFQRKYLKTYSTMSVGGEDSSGTNRLGLLAGTAAYYFRNICEMEDDEIAYIHGNQRETTIGEWYISWASIEFAQPRLVQEMEIWHNQYLYLLQGKALSPQSKNLPIYSVTGLAQAPAVLTIDSPSGVSVCNTEKQNT